MSDLSDDRLRSLSGPARTPEGWFKVTGGAITTTAIDGWDGAKSALRDLRHKYPHVPFKIVPARMPRAHPSPERDLPTTDVNELAHVHHRTPAANCTLCS